MPAVVAVAFAGAGYLGARLADAACAGVAPADDGPRPGRPPVLWLVAVCAALGAALAVQGGGLTRILLSAILCVSLVACWCSDVRCGIVPDVFTLAPLAAVVVAGMLEHEWWHLLAALVPFVLFATAALASKGRGMGWGDVKLATLGGAVLGIGPAMLAFSGASLAAVCVALVRGKRKQPIAFAPYLASAIAAGLFLGIVP